MEIVYRTTTGFERMIINSRPPYARRRDAKHGALSQPRSRVPLTHLKLEDLQPFRGVHLKFRLLRHENKTLPALSRLLPLEAKLDHDGTAGGAAGFPISNHTRHGNGRCYFTGREDDQALLSAAAGKSDERKRLPLPQQEMTVTSSHTRRERLRKANTRGVDRSMAKHRYDGLI